MKFFCALAAMGALLACGGDDAAELPALVEDPAVEQGCATDRPSAGATRAKRVVCTEELLSGRMAAGRVGDLLLENSRIRVIVRGPGDGLYLYGTTGGALVDAAQHGADDLLQEIVPLIELNTGRFTELVIVEAGDDGPAEIAVRGIAEPTPLFASALGTQPANVIVEQRYRLEPDDIAVAIETRVYSQPGVSASQAVGLIDALFLGGEIQTRFPGRDGGPARGPFLASHGSSTSYGIVFHRDDAPAITLLELVFFKLLESPTLSVDGDSLTRYFVVGDGSMSSVVDRSWELYGETTTTVSGTTAPNVDVVARDSSEAVASIARSGDDGSYAFDLPAGSYTLTAEAANRAPGQPVSVDVGASDVSADLVAGDSGAIELTATGDGVGTVARIAISGTGDSAPYERIEYSAADGHASVGVPPGSYTISVSKGMEYDAFTATEVIVPPNGAAAITAPLARVLDTDGWISVDPHMHSEMSIDSSVPLDRRLLSVAAEGVEVAVSSDHDFVVDYAPIATELGLDATLATISGQESSSLIIGHINAWPTPVDPNRPGGGAIPWYGNGPSTVFELAREGDPDRIVQVNHPWHALGLFTAIDFDRATLMATRSGDDLGIPGEELNDFSFDALEVGNAKTNESFERVFGDWLAFVSSGFRITATGASDSHGDDAYIGEARTFVYVGPGQDDPAIIDAETLNDAIRDQHVVVAQGIFVTAGLVLPGGGASIPGELVDLSGESEAIVRIRVQAPPWLPAAAVVIYELDTEIMRIPLDQGDTQAVRYEADVALPIDATDTLFVVVVEAGGDGSPVMDQPEPSFTNPLYVDADGDGSFEASR